MSKSVDVQVSKIQGGLACEPAPRSARLNRLRDEYVQAAAAAGVKNPIIGFDDPRLEAGSKLPASVRHKRIAVKLAGEGWKVTLKPGDAWPLQAEYPRVDGNAYHFYSESSDGRKVLTMRKPWVPDSNPSAMYQPSHSITQHVDGKIVESFESYR
ncbi:MAG: hypothetical protein AAB426_14655 [Myxococcota bacterium]